MDIKYASQLIRKWREDQQLSVLSPEEEKKAAQVYIKQKGLVLPDTFAGMPLVNGVYTNMPTSPTRDQKMFPLDPQDKRQYWSKQYGCYVTLTGDVTMGKGFATYYIRKADSSDTRPLPTKGHELVLAEDADLMPENGEFLEVNLSPWTTIKNFMLDRFVVSYPWTADGEKSPEDVRKHIEGLVKSSRNGLARMVETERKSERGHFAHSVDFVNRMSVFSKEFPWEEFARILDYKPPKV